MQFYIDFQQFIYQEEHAIHLIQKIVEVLPQ